MGIDPKGRVEKACDTNLADKIGKKCGGSVDAAAAFPGCGTGDLGELKDCIDAMVECAVCKSLNEADDLSRDCEAFDDGQANGSCPFGGRCGNGILEGAEECDDGNTFKGDGCSDICVVEFCGDGGFQPGLGEECDDGNMADADGCSAACVVEFCGDGIVQSGIGEDCEDDLACDAGETCDPVVCQCKPAGLEIGPHRCLLDPNSGFVIDTQLAPLAFGFTGSLDIVCGIVDSNSGKAACTCAIQEVDPVNIPGIGYACLNAGGPCAAGEIDCDGGNGLDVDLLTEHNIGACTGDADCRAQCTTHCGASMLFSATCEGFCLFGPNDGKPCTQDTDCPGGSCHGGDGLAHRNICNCYCVDMGGGPSRAGGLKCNLGTDIVIETAAPPCGDGDDLLTVGAQCVPLTTETVTSIVIDANNMALKELPPGGLAATGAPADCLDLAGSVTAGTRLVGAVSFVDTNLGDTAITLVFGCQ